MRGATRAESFSSIKGRFQCKRYHSFGVVTQMLEVGSQPAGSKCRKTVPHLFCCCVVLRQDLTQEFASPRRQDDPISSTIPSGVLALCEAAPFESIHQPCDVRTMHD